MNPTRFRDAPPSPPSPPSAVVFDVDGLLLDTEHAWTRAEQRLFARRGATFTIDHKRELVGSSGAVAHAKLERILSLPGEGAALMAELEELVWDEVEHGAPPRPGAAGLVAALRELAVPVGLATNSPRAFVDRVLQVSGIDGAFQVVVAADEVAHPKPAPDLYLAACEALGAAPAESVALEDSPTGVAAAIAAGMYVIGVPSVEGIVLEAHLVTGSLADRAVSEALGLPTF